jgi:hypothetical protein
MARQKVKVLNLPNSSYFPFFELAWEFSGPLNLFRLFVCFGPSAYHLASNQPLWPPKGKTCDSQMGKPK